MSFGKRGVVTAAPPRQASPRASSPRPAGRPGWWSTYLLALLAAVTTHMVVALVAAAYVSLASDHGFTRTFVAVAAGVVAMLIVEVPVFAVVGGGLRRIGLTNRWLYVAALVAVAQALLHGALALTSSDFNPWTVILAAPSMLAGALALGWNLRPKP
jgi:hypothetical protein